MKSKVQYFFKPVELLLITTVIIILIELYHWLTNSWQGSSIRVDFLPMAPSTMLLILSLGACIEISHVYQESKRLNILFYIIACFVVVYSIYIIVFHALELGIPSIERYISGTQYINNVPVGIMSPITAVIILLSMLSIIGTIINKKASGWYHRIGVLLSILNIVFCLIIIMSYVAGMPFFYADYVVPMALLTAIVLMLLNSAIILLYGSLGWLSKHPFVKSNFDELEQPSPKSNMVFTSVLLMMIITIGGLFFLRQATLNAKNVAFSELKTIERTKIDQINHWYHDNMADAKVILQNRMVQLKAVEYINGKRNSATLEEMVLWMRNRQQGYEYTRFALYDDMGNELIGVPTKESRLIASRDSMYQKTISENTLNVTDLHVESPSSSGKQPIIRMNIWVPVYINDNKTKGAWLIQIDPSNYLYPLIQRWPTNSRSGETLIVRREGDYVVFLSELKHKDNAPLQLHYNIMRYKLLPAALAVLGKTGVYEGLDYRGVPVLSAISAIDGTPWFVVVKMDREEIYHALWTKIWTVSGIVMLLIAMVALSVGYQERKRDKAWIERQLTLSRERQQYAERIANLAEHANDIILTLDSRNQIIDANRKAIESYGYSREELLKMNLYDLCPLSQFDANSCFDITSIAQKGIRNEATHLCKDGRSIYVESSIHAIQIEGETYQQAIIRDITERKLSEAALRESEMKFRNVFNNSPLGKSMTSMTGEMMVNKAYCDMLGYTEAELLTKKWTDITHPDDINETKQKTVDMLNGKMNSVAYEKRYIHKDGSTIWAEVNTTLQRDANQEPMFFVTFIRDITEKKEADEKIKEMTHRLQSIIDKAPFGAHTYMLDANDKLIIIGSNLSANSILGFDNSTLIGMEITEAFPMHRYTNVPAIYREVALTGIPYESIDFSYEDDRIMGAFDFRAIQTGERQITAFFMDVTDRKRTEHEIRENQERLRMSQAIGHVGSWEYKLQENKIWASGEGLNIYGFSQEYQEMPLEQVESCIPERERVHKALIDLIENDAPYDLEFEIRPADGSMPKIVTSKAIITRNENGEPYKVSGVVQDITERKNAENSIKLLNEKLEQKVLERTTQLTVALKELETFSYSVSHDLRAPLRGIDGWSLVLLEDYQDKLDSQGQEALKRIRSEAQRMGKLIDALLDLSKMSRGEIEYKETNISLVAQNIANNLVAAEPTRQINIAIQPDMVDKCDPRLMEILFTNLFSNAIKFTKRREIAHIECGITHTNGEKAYYIKDDGVGFNMEYAGKLFETFQRLHSASEFAGTGIGLATVKRIVTRHGGHIWAKSEPDKFTIVYFTIGTHTSPVL